MSDAPGPNSAALVAPLEKRVKYLEEYHHIPPRLATAMVLNAEMAHASVITAARLGDDVRRTVVQTYLAQWAGIGATFDMCGQPLGLSQSRLYQAAKAVILLTVKENNELEDRLEHDPKFAAHYAMQVAGAEMEKLFEKLNQPR